MTNGKIILVNMSESKYNNCGCNGRQQDNVTVKCKEETDRCYNNHFNNPSEDNIPPHAPPPKRKTSSKTDDNDNLKDKNATQLSTEINGESTSQSQNPDHDKDVQLPTEEKNFPQSENVLDLHKKLREYQEGFMEISLREREDESNIWETSSMTYSEAEAFSKNKSSQNIPETSKSTTDHINSSPVTPSASRHEKIASRSRRSLIPVRVSSSPADAEIGDIYSAKNPRSPAASSTRRNSRSRGSLTHGTYPGEKVSDLIGSRKKDKVNISDRRSKSLSSIQSPKELNDQNYVPEKDPFVPVPSPGKKLLKKPSHDLWWWHPPEIFVEVDDDATPEVSVEVNEDPPPPAPAKKKIKKKTHSSQTLDQSSPTKSTEKLYDQSTISSNSQLPNDAQESTASSTTQTDSKKQKPKRPNKAVVDEPKPSYSDTATQAIQQPFASETSSPVKATESGIFIRKSEPSKFTLHLEGSRVSLQTASPSQGSTSTFADAASQSNQVENKEKSGKNRELQLQEKAILSQFDEDEATKSQHDFSQTSSSSDLMTQSNHDEMPPLFQAATNEHQQENRPLLQEESKIKLKDLSQEKSLYTDDAIGPDHDNFSNTIGDSSSIQVTEGVQIQEKIFPEFGKAPPNKETNGTQSTFKEGWTQAQPTELVREDAKEFQRAKKETQSDEPLSMGHEPQAAGLKREAEGTAFQTESTQHKDNNDSSKVGNMSSDSSRDGQETALPFAGSGAFADSRTDRSTSISSSLIGDVDLIDKSLSVPKPSTEKLEIISKQSFQEFGRAQPHIQLPESQLGQNEISGQPDQLLIDQDMGSPIVQDNQIRPITWDEADTGTNEMESSSPFNDDHQTLKGHPFGHDAQGMSSPMINRNINNQRENELHGSDIRKKSSEDLINFTDSIPNLNKELKGSVQNTEGINHPHKPGSNSLSPSNDVDQGQSHHSILDSPLKNYSSQSSGHDMDEKPDKIREKLFPEFGRASPSAESDEIEHIRPGELNRIVRPIPPEIEDELHESPTKNPELGRGLTHTESKGILTKPSINEITQTLKPEKSMSPFYDSQPVSRESRDKSPLRQTANEEESQIKEEIFPEFDRAPPRENQEIPNISIDNEQMHTHPNNLIAVEEQRSRPVSPAYRQLSENTSVGVDSHDFSSLIPTTDETPGKSLPHHEHQILPASPSNEIPRTHPLGSVDSQEMSSSVPFGNKDMYKVGKQSSYRQDHGVKSISPNLLDGVGQPNELLTGDNTNEHFLSSAVPSKAVIKEPLKKGPNKETSSFTPEPGNGSENEENGFSNSGHGSTFPSVVQRSSSSPFGIDGKSSSNESLSNNSLERQAHDSNSYNESNISQSEEVPQLSSSPQAWTLRQSPSSKFYTDQTTREVPASNAGGQSTDQTGGINPSESQHSYSNRPFNGGGKQESIGGAGIQQGTETRKESQQIQVVHNDKIPASQLQKQRSQSLPPRSSNLPQSNETSRPDSPLKKDKVTRSTQTLNESQKQQQKSNSRRKPKSENQAKSGGGGRKPDHKRTDKSPKSSKSLVETKYKKSDKVATNKDAPNKTPNQSKNLPTSSRSLTDVKPRTIEPLALVDKPKDIGSSIPKEHREGSNSNPIDFNPSHDLEQNKDDFQAHDYEHFPQSFLVNQSLHTINTNNELNSSIPMDNGTGSTIRTEDTNNVQPVHPQALPPSHPQSPASITVSATQTGEDEDKWDKGSKMNFNDTTSRTMLPVDAVSSEMGQSESESRQGLLVEGGYLQVPATAAASSSIISSTQEVTSQEDTKHTQTLHFDHAEVKPSESKMEQKQGNAHTQAPDDFNDPPIITAQETPSQNQVVQGGIAFNPNVMPPWAEEFLATRGGRGYVGGSGPSYNLSTVTDPSFSTYRSFMCGSLYENSRFQSEQVYFARCSVGGTYYQSSGPFGNSYCEQLLRKYRNPPLKSQELLKDANNNANDKNGVPVPPSQNPSIANTIVKSNANLIDKNPEKPEEDACFCCQYYSWVMWLILLIPIGMLIYLIWWRECGVKVLILEDLTDWPNFPIGIFVDFKVLDTAMRLFLSTLGYFAYFFVTSLCYICCKTCALPRDPKSLCSCKEVKLIIHLVYGVVMIGYLYHIVWQWKDYKNNLASSSKSRKVINHVFACLELCFWYCIVILFLGVIVFLIFSLERRHIRKRIAPAPISVENPRPVDQQRPTNTVATARMAPAPVLPAPVLLHSICAERVRPVFQPSRRAQSQYGFCPTNFRPIDCQCPPYYNNSWKNRLNSAGSC